MNEYVTLLGTEAIQSAGNKMVSAAEEMKRAANQIDESLSRFQRFLDDWLIQFQDALGERKP